VTPRRSLTQRQRIKIFEAHNGRCHLCQTRIQVGDLWDVEHVTPLALNGADDETNWKPAHRSCHKHKTRDDVGRIAKTLKQRAKHLGIRKTYSRPIPGSKASGIRKRMNGDIDRW
jgi:5-methylcytosine-specific restriction protein A